MRVVTDWRRGDCERGPELEEMRVIVGPDWRRKSERVQERE